MLAERSFNMFFKSKLKRLVPALLVLLIIMTGCESAQEPLSGMSADQDLQLDTGADTVNSEDSTVSDEKNDSENGHQTASPENQNQAIGDGAAAASDSQKTGSSNQTGDNEKTEKGTGQDTGSASASQAEACTISISCSTLLSHKDSLSASTAQLVPSDGCLLPASSVKISQEDTVFDILQRACRQAGVHMEYTGSASAGTIYIEGIGNIYEFDAGPRSGWMFTVNGKFPDRGCGSVTVSAGDKICWLYTCDLGKDL